ncbi:glyoxalase superfamily protein [Pseudoalteromonas sp. Of7M-16]|uniref:glyoxalase superfamily protein n=1 Tax=Pseudoalteromonas sp. Of7M-16 TaxID=2917756 RepID=UPI001EF4060A|nr:glyoxalase superfamily protein [Pseudoalteromonas sp. Of7M-16]MCG7549299.1 VOC family protein [Pseudoalteromonas sp. Of7M-16]
MALHSIIPIIRSFDENAAHAFYLEFLGFKLDWKHQFEADLPVYMQISKDSCILHISEHYGDASPGVSIRIECDDLKSYHTQLTAKQFKHARPGISEQPWGIEMAISDPFGNKLIFFQSN